MGVKLFRQEAQEAQGEATGVMALHADTGTGTTTHLQVTAMDSEHVQEQVVQAEQDLPAQQDAPLVRPAVIVQDPDSQAAMQHVAVQQAG